MVKVTHRGVKMTVEIPEDLHRRVKVRAAEEGSDVRSIVIEALRERLSEKAPRSREKRGGAR